MVRNSCAAFNLVAALALAGTVMVQAAVPENVIKGWQDSAPEALDITVISADQTSAVRPYSAVPGGSVTTTNVTARAKVDNVVRSASNLTTGAEIIVKYVVQRYQPVAPPDGNFGVLLAPNDKATVYLKKSGDNAYELNCMFGCLLKR